MKMIKVLIACSLAMAFIAGCKCAPAKTEAQPAAQPAATPAAAQAAPVAPAAAPSATPAAPTK